MACFACLLTACLVRVGPNSPVSLPPFGVLVCGGSLGRFPDADYLGPMASFILVHGSCVWAILRFVARLEVMADILLDPTTIFIMCQPMATLDGISNVIANVYL